MFATEPSHVMCPHGTTELLLLGFWSTGGTVYPSIAHRSRPTSISSCVVTGDASAATLFWL